MKTNYKLKAELLNNGTFEDFSKVRKMLYHEEIDTTTFFEYLSTLGTENAKECSRILNANIQRTKRLKNRIAEMLALGQCKFITITFRNDVLESTSQLTRRRYVSRWLSQYGYYVANIDFGSHTEREHYHAILLVNHLEKTWPYGFIDIKTARTKNASNVRLAKYISKLTNHAIKETTKQQRLIYSKDFSKLA